MTDFQICQERTPYSTSYKSPFLSPQIMASLNSAVAPQHITRKNELQKEKGKINPLKRILI